MAPPIRRHSIGIVQVITAASQFDGTVPSTNPIRSGEVDLYPTDVAGGLFDFDHNRPVVVSSVRLFLGGQSSWSLSIVAVSNREFVWLSGTSEPSFIAAGKDVELPLLPGEKLKLVTTGASTVMEAFITVKDETFGARRP
jgi:hypothetical protein